MAYRDPYARPNDTYNSIREQIDPSSLQLHRPSNTYVATNPRIDASSQQRWQPDASQRRSYQVESTKKSEIKNRIKEIIDLCKGEN
jgi:exopolyphosphatase/pppGpp-phosphohydrolase